MAIKKTQSKAKNSVRSTKVSSAGVNSNSVEDRSVSANQRIARSSVNQEMTRSQSHSAMRASRSPSEYLDLLLSNAGTILLVVAAFFLGMLWTQVRYLTQGVNPAGIQPAKNPTVQAPATPTPQLTDQQWDQLLGDGAAGQLGRDNAKVTMVEFTDYQCPFCARHYTETHLQLVKKYVESGDLRIIYRDLPLPFHPNARDAAIAVRCGGEQGLFEEMHDVLFVKQTDWENLPVTDAKARFASYAVEAGAGQAAFTACQENPEVGAAVDADLALANQFGATGTPSFFIEGKLVVGALPYSNFQTEIEALLQ